MKDRVANRNKLLMVLSLRQLNIIDIGAQIHKVLFILFKFLDDKFGYLCYFKKI